MNGALDGVKVLGFTHFAQAPLALQMLGDLGADVINIEAVRGEHERFITNHPAVGGESLYFLSMNRNKRCLTLNLKSPEGREVARKLLRRCDVVVNNFRAGTMERLGFGYEAVKELNPRVIYGEALGYGRDGPYADRPGQDLLAQCLSGYASICGTAGSPMPGGAYLVDAYSSILLTTGILAALYDVRVRGGDGQIVSVNLLDSAIHIQGEEFTHYLNSRELPRRAAVQGGHVHMKAPYGIYRTQDGYMAISVTDADKASLLGQLLGRPDLAALMPDDETMQTDKDRIFAAIQEALLTRKTEYWVETLLAHGFWAAKFNDYAAVERDPQVIHNGIIQELDHPVAGRIKVVGPGIYLSKTPATIRRSPPTLGQHSAEILRELGYSEEEIAAFKAKKII